MKIKKEMAATIFHTAGVGIDKYHMPSGILLGKHPSHIKNLFPAAISRSLVIFPHKQYLTVMQPLKPRLNKFTRTIIEPHLGFQTSDIRYASALSPMIHIPSVRIKHGFIIKVAVYNRLPERLKNIAGNGHFLNTGPSGFKYACLHDNLRILFVK